MKIRPQRPQHVCRFKKFDVYTLDAKSAYIYIFSEHNIIYLSTLLSQYYYKKMKKNKKNRNK